MDKKNFSYKKIDYTVVIGARNYIEFYRDYRLVINMQRTRIYKGFAASNDFNVLQTLAESYFDKWLFDNEESKKIKPPNKLFQYLEDNKYRWRPKTYIGYNGIVKKFSLWCDKNRINVDIITPSEAQKFIAHCVNSGFNNTTILNSMVVLKLVYSGLGMMKIIDNDSIACLPKIKKNPNSLQHFSKSHIQSITDHCKIHNFQILVAIKLLYSCFIRPGEMRFLQLYDINLEDKYIRIDGKISKNKKTQKVKIPDTLITDLEFIKKYPQHYYLLSKSNTPGQEIISSNWINTQHAKILKELKIHGNFAFYSWKHTGVIQAVRNGVNMKTLQLQLRHHSLDMVNEYLKNLGIMDDMDCDNKLPTL
jgi:integrase